MGHSVRKIFLLSICAFAVIVLLLSVAHAQNTTSQKAAPSSTTGVKTAAQQFKNIKVLKDIPADELIPSMQFISAALGVDCEYCHVEHEFDKDDKKPKQYARHMMEMTIAINRDNFEGKRWVTCNSCHRGSAHPVATPVISAEMNIPEMMEGSTVSATSLPTGESLLEKYVAAIGGADALKKITSRIQQGTVTAFGDQKTPMEIFSKAPDKRLSVMHLKNGDSFTGYNGKVGWLSVPGRTRLMNAQDASVARLDADIALPIDVQAMYSKWEVEAGPKIDGKDTWHLTATKDGVPPLQLYLDQETGLLLRMLRYADSPLGYNPSQVDYSDYRVADGVKVPYRWTLSRPGNQFTIQVDQLQQNVPVDDAKFNPPAQAADPGKH